MIKIRRCTNSFFKNLRQVKLKPSHNFYNFTLKLPEFVNGMLKNKTTHILTLFVALLVFNCIEISGAGQDSTATKAFQLFDNGQFTEAEPYLKKLLDKNPEFVMLNYYYGACRTENGFYSEQDMNYLTKANQEGSPAKIDYYLGVQNQARNNWDQALRHYNRFKFNSSEEERTALMLTEKIQQCYNHENPFRTKQEETGTDQSVDSAAFTTLLLSDTIILDKKITDAVENKELNANLKDTTKLPEPPEENIKGTARGNPVKFMVSNKITYFDLSHFKTEEGKKLLIEGESKQKELDRTVENITRLREEYRLEKSETAKAGIGEKILSFENESYQLQEEINRLFSQARTLEENYWQNAPEDEIEKFINEIKKYTIIQNAPEPLSQQEEIIPDIPEVAGPGILVASPSETTASDNTKTDELVYKVQIGAFSKKMPAYIDRMFKKLSLIRKIDNYTDEKGVVVYTTGNLTNLNDAVALQKQVRQEGVQDAFVVAFFNGKRITLEQAKEIEGI